MSKKELSEEIKRLGGNIEALMIKIHRLESYQGTIPHNIEVAVKPLRENLAFNAKLMNLLTEHFNIGFYETPAQPSKIQIRKKEKVAINPSKRSSRPSTSRVGKKKL